MLLSVYRTFVLTFKMELTRTSKTLVHMYHTTWRHTAEDGNCISENNTLNLTQDLRNNLHVKHPAVFSVINRNIYNSIV